MPARSNVTPYYDENGVAKEAYRESPYYMELTGSWQQRQTDSSVCYIRQVEVEKSWKDYLVYLNVRAGRAVRVSVNGKEVGYADDSRHWNEFLLTSSLRYDRANTLVIETLHQGQGALLEDATLSVGLNGEPYLIFKNDPNVSDFTLTADYDAASTTGILSVSANVFCGKHKGKYYLEVEIWDPRGRSFDRMGRWVVFNGRSEETVDISRSWAGVSSWNAETPNLYTAVIRLRNDKMEEEEIVGARFGFRRVEVKDGVLQLNGKAITLKGVTYGVEHTEGYASRQQMQRDVEAMKRNNINAVRTSRYSPMDPWFYELCDRYGLYVVCDANMLPLSEQRQAVATNPDYMSLFEHRVENMYGKYKNHTSIIAWSLGNTHDNAVCMTAAYKRLKAKDKTRLVIFSGADYGDATDVIAPQQPESTTLRQSLKKQGERPYLLLTSVDKTHFADLEALWKLVIDNRQLQGGFVDAWPLGNVMLSELKYLYQPFDVSLDKMTPDDGEFVVFNRNDFTPFGHYSLDYNIFTNMRPSITGGELPAVPPCGGSDKVSMRIPHVNLQAGEEMFIRFNLRLSGQSVSATQGTVVFPLENQKRTKPMFENGGEITDIPDLILTDLGFVNHSDWHKEIVDRRERRPDAQTFCIDVMERYVEPESGAAMCDVRSTYTCFGSGDVVLDYTVFPSDLLRGTTLQPIVKVFYEGDSVTWFGIDREICFREGKSADIGVFDHAADGVVRQQVRWCATHKGGEGLFLEMLDEKCGMKVTKESVMLLPENQHSFRLHLRPYSGAAPADFYGKAYPRMQAGVLEMPVITASDTRFSAPLIVTIASNQTIKQSDNQAIIRYTLDGSDPTMESPLYTAPFEITSTTTVKARAFAKDLPPSFTATRKFNYDHIVKTTFSRKASTPYNLGADTILFDGVKGTIEDLSQGWLGFSGEPVVTIVQLAKLVNVESVTLRYAHTPGTWAFAPRQVMIALSADGITYGDTLIADIPFDPADEEEATPRVTEIKVPVGKDAVGFMKIIPKTIDRIPAWHRAKGLKPWMLMDEIEISEK